MHENLFLTACRYLFIGESVLTQMPFSEIQKFSKTAVECLICHFCPKTEKIGTHQFCLLHCPGCGMGMGEHLLPGCAKRVGKVNHTENSIRSSSRGKRCFPYDLD